MSTESLQLLRKIAKEQEVISNNYVPALDEILLFALERKYLGVGRLSELAFDQTFKDTRKNKLGKLCIFESHGFGPIS